MRDGFGGISGLDGDGRGNWYLISDDRSARAPARFYVASIRFGRGGPRVVVRAARTLRTRDGRPFGREASNGEAPDAEAIRFDARTASLLWSSEGDGRAGPSVRRMTRSGAEIGTIALPSGFAPDAASASGPRANLSIEGLALDPAGGLWVALEAPLLQDGPPAGLGRPARVRLTRIGPDGRVRQVAYALDPIRFASQGRRADNGISEVLALDRDRLLVLERSGIERADGSFAYHCRLYLADTAQAEDVAGLPSLAGAAPRLATKTLIFDFDTLPGARVDNLEAMAWAPRARDPRGRLMLMTDSNFDPAQPTTLLVMDVLRRGVQNPTRTEAVKVRGAPMK